MSVSPGPALPRGKTVEEFRQSWLAHAHFLNELSSPVGGGVPATPSFPATTHPAAPVNANGLPGTDIPASPVAIFASLRQAAASTFVHNPSRPLESASQVSSFVPAHETDGRGRRRHDTLAQSIAALVAEVQDSHLGSAAGVVPHASDRTMPELMHLISTPELSNAQLVTTLRILQRLLPTLFPPSVLSALSAATTATAPNNHTDAHRTLLFAWQDRIVAVLSSVAANRPDLESDAALLTVQVRRVSFGFCFCWFCFYFSSSCCHG